MDSTTSAILTGGLSKMFGGGGGLFGGGDDSMKDMIRLIQQNTAAAEKDYGTYLQGGQSAQEQMMAQLGLGGPAKAFDVTQLPGYQSALQQGLAGVNQGAAGAGMLMSGERLKGLQSTGHTIFGDYYKNYMSGLTGMANQGMSAAGNLANIRTGGMTQQLGLMQEEQAQKAGMMGDLLGLAGTVGGFMVGGPPGAAVGQAVTSSYGPQRSGYSGATGGGGLSALKMIGM